MALTDKDILITPNKGQASDPKIDFVGADASTGPQTVTLRVYPLDNGTVSFEGSAGQLFSISNSLSGTIYSVNDISGMPSIEVLDTGTVKIAQYSGNVLLGTGSDNGSDKLQVAGNISVTGTVDGRDLSVDGAKLDGIAAGAQVNVPTNLSSSRNATSFTIASSTGNDTNLAEVSTTLPGIMFPADKVKLDGIQAGAQVNVPTNLGYTTADTTGTVTSSTGTNATIPAATTSLAGLMSNTDKTKLDGIAAGAQVNVPTNLSYTTAATTGTVVSSTGTNAVIPAATTSLAGLMSNTDKSKLDGIAAGAQTNQNAFSNVAVSGQTTVAADAPTDTLTLAAGTGVSITTNATTDTVTITNSAPDQTVSLTGSGATSVSGTYPSFTISSTDTNTTYTAGNGLTLTGTTFAVGTPSTLTTGTTNAVTATSHTHAVTFPVTSVAGKTGAVTLSASDVGAAATNQTMYIGTTAVAINRTSAAITLSGTSISGNAGTATTLQTARTINGTSFNGSANITITANTPNTLTRGSYLTGNNFNGSAATTWAVDATSANTASKVVARDGSGNFSAGTITASLSGNSTTSTSAQTGIFEMPNVITANKTISSGNNAISAGPIDVAAGIIVTIPPGSTWTVV